MNDIATIGLLDAARQLGVSIGLLRRAIRAGRIPTPPNLSATASLPYDWLSSVKETVAASPNVFTGTLPQKVPAFARYEGTSAWQKYRHRARAYARFRAEAKAPA